VRVALENITVSLAGRATPSETTLATVGAYVVVVATTLPDVGGHLTSVYLAALNVGPIAASHLLTAPGEPPRITQRGLHAGPASVTHARACLLDHAAELRDALAARTAQAVGVDVPTATLQTAEQAWGEPRRD
jgi:hypothetical protein